MIKKILFILSVIFIIVVIVTFFQIISWLTGFILGILLLVLIIFALGNTFFNSSNEERIKFYVPTLIALFSLGISIYQLLPEEPEFTAFSKMTGNGTISAVSENNHYIDSNLYSESMHFIVVKVHEDKKPDTFYYLNIGLLPQFNQSMPVLEKYNNRIVFETKFPKSISQPQKPYKEKIKNKTIEVSPNVLSIWDIEYGKKYENKKCVISYGGKHTSDVNQSFYDDFNQLKEYSPLIIANYNNPNEKNIYVRAGEKISNALYGNDKKTLKQIKSQEKIINKKNSRESKADNLFKSDFQD